MENPVIIFGANYLGRVAKEIFESNQVVVYGFLDDTAKLHKTEIDNVVVLGGMEDEGFLKLIGKKCEAFIAVDDNPMRKSLVNMLLEVRHTQPVNAIHSGASVSALAELGHGNFIDNGAIVSVGARLGSHGLIHAQAVVGAEVQLGNFVQVGAGSIINPGVTVGDDVFIGSGVTIVAGIEIGKGARIGAGSVVIASVKQNETVFGNPAVAIKK